MCECLCVHRSLRGARLSVRMCQVPPQPLNLPTPSPSEVDVADSVIIHADAPMPKPPCFSPLNPALETSCSRTLATDRQRDDPRL